MSVTLAFEHIDTTALRMSWFLVPWDTAALGRPVVQIDALELVGDDPATDFGQFESWCERADAKLISCRLPNERLRESGWLESRGFRFIEMMFRPGMDLQRPTAQAAATARPVTIARATERDIDALAELAAVVFTTGRFWLDPRLDRSFNGTRYARWVRSSFDNPAHQVLKAEVDGDVAGFFIVEDQENGHVYWHLTAVAPAYQGRGVGKALWYAMLERHRASGRRHVETCVSAHNLPILNLYAQLGFRIAQGGMTFHRVVP